MKKILTRILTIILCLSMLLGSTAYAEEVQPESGQQAQTELDSYFRFPFRTLREEDRLKLPDGMSGVVLSVPKNSNGLLFTGTVDALQSGKMEILHDFNFDRNPVGRISLDGLRDRGLNVKVHIYLDGEEEPFLTYTLAGQMGKKEWENDGEKSLDISDKKLTGKHRVFLSFEIAGAAGDQTAKILLRSIEFAEESIPVLYFNIDESQGTVSAMNSSPDHSVECYGTVDLRVPEEFENEYGKPQDDLKDLELEYIRGRGNSTWDADKKPYKVKFKEKQNFFNMGKNKHWILLANHFDHSLLRNRMTYWLGKMFGLDYTPECQPVEVVMNGAYYGSYLLCEQIRIGKGRVEIDDLEDNQAAMEATEEPEITGGYLLSLDLSGEEEERTITTLHKAFFYLESPTFEDYYNETQANYIKNYLQKIEDAIYGKNFKDAEGKSYLEYLDLDAAANYWWIQEFSANGDAYTSGSTYLYKKRDSEEGPGKLYWGPLWDFDLVAWGDLQYDLEVPENLDNTNMLWFTKMMEDPAFIDKLRERWEVLKVLLDEITQPGGQIDRYSRQTEVSAAYDREKWGPFVSESGTVYSYEEEIEQLRNWIVKRKENVENSLDSLEPNMYTVTFMSGNKVLETRIVREGEALEQLPEIPAKAGYVYGGWYSDSFGFIEEGEEVYFDMTLTQKYLKSSEITPAKNLYFAQYDVYLDEDNEEGFTPVYSICPSEATFAKVTWSSDDTGIATVNDEGLVMCTGKKGTSTITGKLDSGVTASYRVHVYNWIDTPPQETEYLNLNRSSLTLTEGNYAHILAETGPNPPIFMGNPVLWMSMDESIATVDECGVVTGLKPGTTILVACVVDNMHINKTCKVTVTKSMSSRIREAKAKKVKIKAKGLKSHKIKLTWKALSGVSGYQVFRGVKKKGRYKKVATIRKAKTAKWISKKQRRGKRWYFKVRPYTRIGNKIYYGKWSNIVKKKVP